jgi:pimeloyl-ACP methyl ester carboxylesterase
MAAASVRPTRADTVPPATVREVVIPLQADGFPIHAVLTLPGRMATGPARATLPVVLIVAGSGPTDYQGNSLAAPVRPYLHARLAWGLAERGIASVRYDKRGIGRSAAGAGSPTTLTLGRYRDDVVALARQLRADPRFGRLVLLGHSEGAGLVLEATNAGAPADGFIMLAGAGRPLIQLLRDQFHVQYDSATSARIEAHFRAFLDGAEPAEHVPDNVKPLVMPQYRPMLRSMAAYDPAGEMRRSRLPALVVHGGMDLQATSADFDALVAARPTVDRLVIPLGNHVFKAVTARTMPAQMSAYMDPTLDLVPELVPGIAAWIEQIGSGRTK